MDRVAVSSQRPVNACFAHLLFERRDLSLRDKRVIRSMKCQYFSFNVLCIFGIGCAQTAMKTDDARNVCPAARQFESRRATETIANGSDPPGVSQFVLLENIQPSIDSGPKQRTIFFVLARFRRRVLRIG